MEYNVHDRVRSEQPCKLCGHHELQVIATRGRHFQKLTTAICTGCGLIHSYPIPTKEALDHYYSETYRSEYKGARSPKKKHVLRYSRTAARRLGQLEKFATRGQKLLDVGSGSGEFVYMASLSGFEAHGIEPHLGYSKYTRKTFGIEVISSPLETADIPDGSYDIVTLHHVLEHLHYPLTSLSTINRWLKPGGLLAVEVPDIENTQHSPTNRFHYAHIYNFNHETMKALLEKAGFTLEPGPRHRGTALFARKIAEPDPARLIPMPDNYQRLLHLMSKEVAAENYRKKQPLKRIFTKLHRYPAEFLEAVLLWNPRKIVHQVFNATRA